MRVHKFILLYKRFSYKVIIKEVTTKIDDDHFCNFPSKVHTTSWEPKQTPKRKTPPFNNQALHAHTRTHRWNSSPFYTLEYSVNFLRLPIWVTHTRPFGRTYIYKKIEFDIGVCALFREYRLAQNFDRETIQKNIPAC